MHEGHWSALREECASWGTLFWPLGSTFKVGCCIVTPQPQIDIPSIWTRSIIFGWWPLSIYATHLLQTMAIITPILIIPSIHLLLPADICFHPSWATHKPHHWLIYNSLIYHLHVRRGLASYDFRDNPWNVVESKTIGILSRDKVPLGDNKGGTGRKCI